MNLDADVLKEIKMVAAHYEHISKILLFGSRSRGDNHSRSDIDLAVYATESISLFIEEINFTVNTLLEFDITLITDQTEDYFLSQVLKEGIVIYEKIRI